MDDWRLMPPWEANTYFDLPAAQQFTAGGSPQRVAIADSQRVYIAFSTNTEAGPVVCLSEADSLVARGYMLDIRRPILELVHSLHGLLVAQEFWATVAPGFILSVVSVRLRLWPAPARPGAKRVQAPERGDLHNPDRRRW